VRVEGVVLEDHGDVAVLGRQVGDVAVTDEDLAAVDLFEAGEHAQGGGLATSRGADETRNSPSAMSMFSLSIVGLGLPG
jgi:hypothetical protein